MTNKATKRALLTSVLALLLCVSMLVGTTYAWFTDSVTSTNNKIVAGNLKIDLELLGDNGWTSIKKSGAPIFNYENWEPGYTDMKILKIENEGSLALKWVAKFTAEKALSKLAQVIDVYVNTSVTAYPTDRADLSDWTYAGTVAEFVNTIESTTNGSLEKDGVAYLGIALKMREDAGNEYQGLDLGGAFDIQIFATQYTFESDSFGPDYDENAAYSVWNGVVPTEMPETLVVDGATQTVHVKDAAAFVYLSKLSADWVSLYTDGQGTTYTNYVNGKGGQYYYSGQWTISLEADIDLNNHKIVPVEIMFGQGTGATAFNGNNHTIRNINATTGLFATGTRATFANLALLNVTATNGALIGGANHGINNVTVKNASISGVDYVGGLVGKTYSSIINCVVEDSIVVATGKEAGGLTGYAEANSKGSEISNNIVRGVSVYANNRAAGLVAQPNKGVKVYNNIVDTVTVGAEDLSNYQCGAVVSNALDATNVYDNTVRNADVMAAAVAVVDSVADLKAANVKDATIVVASGTYNEIPALKEGVTLIGSGDVEFNATIGNYTTLNNVTVKNVTFSNGNAQRWSYAKGTVVFENCTFDAKSVYAIHYDGVSGADVTYKNCTIIGWAAITGGANSMTFDGCKIYGNGTYGVIRVYGDTTIKNCTFDVADVNTADVFQDGIHAVDCTVTVENCTNVNGAIEDIFNVSGTGVINVK